MSITSALSNALSGLSAAGRSAQVVSSNLSNAMTPGYARRNVELSADVLGGSGAGVRIDGISRFVDRVVLADRRLSDAALGQEDTRTGFLSAATDLVGRVEDPDSLSALMARFEGELVSAAARPDSMARLTSSVEAAEAVVQALNTASDGVQARRLAADQAIAADVETLNDSLNRLVDLNAQIAVRSRDPGGANALLDQRQQLIDKVSAIVPVRIMPRQADGVALITTGGQILLDGRAAEVGFTPVSAVDPTVSHAGGFLSGLTVNGDPVAAKPGGRFDGGTLSAQFEVRDTLAPQAQARLDAVARDLVERFEAPGVDPTRAAGAPGLFTDRGAPLDPADETGLSARIALNAAVVAAEGGAAWRLRDGLGAAAEGNVGDARGLNRLLDALSAPRSPASGDFGGAQVSAGGLADRLMAISSADQAASETSRIYAQTRNDALRTEEMTHGVDSDQELQKLMLVEQAYAANARVVQTVDAMIQRLMEI
ncbi:flagellar hook-associated protein FlgK [Mesobaculum littorinae]|uniref:Flagellar hook-associated protein 1 n=1 Tax=Mesobaculum littorinae TaxID=2486419 RepID=A0A438AGZ0_9RHOB|nr:flagellar hook-associated protein FlgK [Mesobaculum littorinae]RVV97980.1 flagellar hook-associated protein FlgK [Mesobaculum littorinae]